MIPNDLPLLLDGESLRTWIYIRSKAPGFIVSAHTLQSVLGYSMRNVRRIIADLKAKGMLETTPVIQGDGRPFHSYTAVLPDASSTTTHKD